MLQVAGHTWAGDVSTSGTLAAGTAVRCVQVNILLTNALLVAIAFACNVVSGFRRDDQSLGM